MHQRATGPPKVLQNGRDVACQPGELPRRLPVTGGGPLSSGETVQHPYSCP